MPRERIGSPNCRQLKNQSLRTPGGVLFRGGPLTCSRKVSVADMIVSITVMKASQEAR
jgi:hypothetical protein